MVALRAIPWIPFPPFFYQLCHGQMHLQQTKVKIDPHVGSLNSCQRHSLAPSLSAFLTLSYGWYFQASLGYGFSSAFSRYSPIWRRSKCCNHLRDSLPRFNLLPHEFIGSGVNIDDTQSYSLQTVYQMDNTYLEVVKRVSGCLVELKYSMHAIISRCWLTYFWIALLS